MTAAFGLLVAGGILLMAGVRNRSIGDILRGITSPLMTVSQSGMASGTAALTSANAVTGTHKLTELLNEGSHIHCASCDRQWLIQLAAYAQNHYGLSVREFPPFENVDCVHVPGSWHYRDSSNCQQPRSCSNKGDGLAFDASGAQQGAFYAYCQGL